MEFNLNYHINQMNEIKDMVYHVLREKSYQHLMYTHIEGAITHEPVSFKDKDRLMYRTYKIGESWGDLFDCGWFKISGNIRQHEKEELFIKLDISGEALLFDKQGTPLKGFTNGSSVFDRQHGEPGKQYYNINHLIDESGYFELWFDAGANDLFGSLQNQGKIVTAEVVMRHLDIRNLYYDLSTLYDLLASMDDKDASYKALFDDLRKIYYEVIYEKPAWIENAKKIALSWLSKPSSSRLNVYAVGHAHMDLAWLWPIRETKRKIGRTIANVIDLLDRYPDFVFGISQPQQIEWLRENYPQLFSSFKAYVDQGRIELQGGMWVEADTNLSGGESLIRQIYYGQKYYKDTFNQTVKNLWLPDVFGYSGNIPQIMKHSGLDYFMTIKLSWSLVNRFPYHTFIWEGIDGSSVITHMPPEGTYNSAIRPDKLKYMDENYIEKDRIPHALNLYGIGDGGGGPGYEHIERIHRTKNLISLPKISMQSAQSFFDILETYKDHMHTWKGELYLENHQGTLTSQANLKKEHRFMEMRLKSIETVLTQHGMYQAYTDRLEIIWKEHLLYEFHDILPGSSIKRVYDECLARYKALNLQLNEILKEAFPSFINKPMIDAYPFNTNIYASELVEKIDDTYVTYLIKPMSNHQIDKKIYKPLKTINHHQFSIKDYDISFSDTTGQITSIIHRSSKTSLIKEKYANVLSVYIDLGDAWNIMDHYRHQVPKHMKLDHRQVIDYGRYIELTHHYSFQSSTLIEKVIIDTLSNQVTFKHDVDWHDVGYMLRTNFPLRIATKEAIFDIQFGEIKRPRTMDNLIDSAKFEVCGHQYATIHDGLFGASLINNSKYGFHVQLDAFDMNLLRSTNYPAVQGDIGKSSYTYALLLHEKTHQEEDVDKVAGMLNTYYPYFTEVLEDTSLFSIDYEHIEYTALKVTYKGDGILIRFHEKYGKKTNVTIEWHRKPKALYLTNLLEEDEIQIDSEQLSFDPYQIKTLKVVY